MKYSKFLIVTSFLLLILCCHKKPIFEKENDRFFKKSRFIFSDFKKSIDSIDESKKKNDSIEILPIVDFKKYNESYYTSKLHFLIGDDNQSFYFVDKEFPLFEDWCGYESNVKINIKVDSIKMIKKSIDKLDHLHRIKTDDIVQILQKYKDPIVGQRRLPYPITFALKKDTLEGPIFHNISNYMDQNEMYLYHIRKMNREELAKMKEW